MQMLRPQASSTRLNNKNPSSFQEGAESNKKIRVLEQTHPVLERISMTDDRTRTQHYLDKSYEEEFHMVKARQITKLEKMKTINMKI